jgi:hypothetical protein
MPKLYNLARMATATTGIGTITLGSATPGFLTFSAAGVANGDVVFYGLKDGTSSEAGYGTYTSSGTTLTRNVVKSTNSNTAIALSGAAEVYITALASDGGDLIPGFTNPMRGFDLPLNLQLNASVASNILTVAVKGNNGGDPSNSNPVLIPFRDPTVANGDPVWRSVTSALSINTAATGATLGSASSSTPFRFWVVAFDNAGTVVLGLINCVGSGSLFPLDETSVQASSAIGASATSAGLFYTQSAIVSGKAFRILGYIEYSSGLTTAGTYASAPTKVQLFGPGVRKPGELVGFTQMSTTTATSTTSSTPQPTACHSSLNLSSAANVVKVEWAGPLNISSNGDEAYVTLYRGNNATTTQIGPWAQNIVAVSNTGTSCGAAGSWFDLPFAGATTTASYTVGIMTNAGGTTVQFPSKFGTTGNAALQAAAMNIQEIMG